jgi:hypothetical protein
MNILGLYLCQRLRKFFLFSVKNITESRNFTLNLSSLSRTEYCQHPNIFFFKFFIHLFTCIHCLGHFSLLSLYPSLSLPPPLLPGQDLFCALLQFCCREDIKNNKNDTMFLPVWNKDSYTERFLAWLPCTSVLQLKLIHLYQKTSLLPSHLPMATSVILRFLY